MDYAAKPSEVYFPTYNPESFKIILTLACEGLEEQIADSEASQKPTQKFIRESVFS